MNLVLIKTQLEQMTCPTHGKHPDIMIVNGNIIISHCCEDFKAQVMQREKELRNSSDKK